MQQSLSVLDHYVHRLNATRNQQLLGHAHVAEDPLTGRRVAVTPARANRPGHGVLGNKVRSVDPGACLCSNPSATPAVLAYVDGNGAVVVPAKLADIDHANEFLSTRDKSDPAVLRELTESLRSHNALEPGFRAKLVRNLYHTPRLGSLEVMASLVASVSPEHHESEFSALPMEIIAALIDLWKLAEAAAERQNLVALPFANVGFGGRAGNTFRCPHTQLYVLKDPPAKHYQIRERLARGGRCPLCRMATADASPLRIPFPGDAEVRLCAHPAPEQTWSLLVLPARHSGSLTGVCSLSLARAILAGVSAWKRHFGAEPDFNIVARTGVVGHAHIELTPRNTNTAGGAELASGEVVIDVEPERVRERLVAHVC